MSLIVFSLELGRRKSIKGKFEKERRTSFQKSLKGGMPSMDFQEYCLKTPLLLHITKYKSSTYIASKLSGGFLLGWL
jgi:hypothetical protein